MININRILSDVQNDIQDQSMDRIQYGEYVDFCNDLLKTIGEETEIYLGRYQTIPNPTATPVTTNLAVLPYTDTNNNILAPYRIMQVSLSQDNGSTWTEYREFTYNNIETTIMNFGESYPQNQMSNYDIGFSTTTLDNTNTDGKAIRIARPFGLDEIIRVDFISSVPFTFVRWNSQNAISIPDFLRDTMRYGLMFRCLERLTIQGDRNKANLLSYAETKYREALRKAMGYAHNLKDKNSTLQAKPHIWLPE